jgi:hypothetical protein
MIAPRRVAAVLTLAATAALPISSAWSVTPSRPMAVRAAAATRHPFLGVDLYSLSNYPAAKVRVYGQRTLSYIKNFLHAGAVGIV